MGEIVVPKPNRTAMAMLPAGSTSVIEVVNSKIRGVQIIKPACEAECEGAEVYAVTFYASLRFGYVGGLAVTFWFTGLQHEIRADGDCG